MFTETSSTSEQEPDSVMLAGFRSLSAGLCVKLSSAVACLSQKSFRRDLHPAQKGQERPEKQGRWGPRGKKRKLMCRSQWGSPPLTQLPSQVPRLPAEPSPSSVPAQTLCIEIGKGVGH